MLFSILEAAPGFEPGIRDLQSRALPLGHAATGIDSPPMRGDWVPRAGDEVKRKSAAHQPGYATDTFRPPLPTLKRELLGRPG